VALNGSQHLHAVASGVRAQYEDVTLYINTTDAAVVSLGPPSPFPIPLQPSPDTSSGVSFALFNNIWNTNYILWYPYLPQDKNSLFRFVLNAL
jgi:hypothetical protein